MKTLKQFEKNRIMNMAKDVVKCICPSCKEIVYPRFVDYSAIIGLPNRSNLDWCPKCLKGKAGIFWREI